MSRKITHIGFSDESNWNVGRFRSLALVTLSMAKLETLQSNLQQMLKDYGIKEFKWQKLRSTQTRVAALKICDYTIGRVRAGDLRIDVLVWDTEDSRHKVKGRDDTANLERMYYHLFRNVMRMRWPHDAVWKLCPDQNTALDWQNVKKYLDIASYYTKIERSDMLAPKLRKEFNIEEINPSNPKDSPLLQLADFFAGLAGFSYRKFDEYSEWIEKQARAIKLSSSPKIISPSNSDRNRFAVLEQFYIKCRENKLGVSLKTSRGLRTRNPAKPINFWMYTPQHPNDKAPTK